MASNTHMATPEDDARHTPGPGALPLWNESYWFAFYDPAAQIGVTARLGMHPVSGEANVYLLISHGDSVVYSLIDQRAPVPAMEDARVSVHGYTITCEEPLERFRLTYEGGGQSMDVVWQAMSPTCMWPFPPGATVEQTPRHIEHAGTVRGKIRLGAREFTIDCLGHRDHSWGGERDWSKIHRWEYLSGEIDKDFWFNAVQLTLQGIPQQIHVGCLWDGNEVMMATKIAMDVRTVEGGSRATDVDLRITDERGHDWEISGETVFAQANVWFGRTSLRDGFVRYRLGDRVGYGILEHGYVERDD